MVNHLTLRQRQPSRSRPLVLTHTCERCIMAIIVRCMLPGSGTHWWMHAMTGVARVDGSFCTFESAGVAVRSSHRPAVQSCWFDAV